MSPADNGAALRLDGLVKRFGTTTAVAGVDLDVRTGEFITLLGPSGSGKTTILRTVAGFEQPTEGRILLDGTDISGLTPAKRNIGMVFQHYALFPHMTVADNIRYPLKLRRWSREEAGRRVDEMLELIGMPGFGDRLPRQLSGGQQQRVALARALAFRPSLLLMDEPLGALDRALRRGMEEEIRRIHRQTGCTVLYVTHDQEEALTMSDRIGVMRDGRLLQLGSAPELFQRPVDSFIAGFLGECTLFPAEVLIRNGDRFRVRVAGHELDVAGTLPAGQSRGLIAVRPTRTELTSNADVCLPAEVVDVLYLGESTRVLCKSETDGMIVAMSHSHRTAEVAIGSRVEVGFEADAAILMPEAPTS
jgi:ABC-type Fe3+/spermidine/putrescine transport system ATPase subunit